MMSRAKILILCMALLFIWNCRKSLEADQTHMGDYAWELYALQDYQNANFWFQEAVFNDSVYKDAYNGLGWTYGKLGNIQSSISNFEFGLTLVLKDTTVEDINLLGYGHNVGQQIYAGLTMAYHAKGDSVNYVKSLSYGNIFLAMTGDSAYSTSQVATPWQFSRDKSVSSRHIIWTMASSYFALSQFDQCLNKLHQLMSTPSSFAPDVATVEGRRELAEQLETLRATL
ncbi:MAG: hypothetical protein ACE5EE_10850 [Fidelibacterota bacterium]